MLLREVTLDFKDVEVAISEALLDDELARPNGCRYVGKDGKRCIVGTVLHRAGFSDEELVGVGVRDPARKGIDPNQAGIKVRHDLHQKIEEIFGPDACETLMKAQRIYDSSSGTYATEKDGPASVKAHVLRYYGNRAA